MSAPRYLAIPLADRGFLARGLQTNRVRWYVEDTKRQPALLLGPYSSMEAADFAAGELNQEETKS